MDDHGKEGQNVIILINLNWLTLCHVMLSGAKHLYDCGRDPSLTLTSSRCPSGG